MLDRERNRIVWCTPGIANEVALLDSVRADGWAVSRHCVDATDVLAAVTVESGSIAVVSAGMQRIDAALWSDLCSRAAAVIVLGEHDAVPVPSGSHVHIDVGHDGASAVLLAALESSPATWVDGRGRGSIVAVWGTAGAPGRTTVTVALSEASAALGFTTFMIDGDTHNPSISCNLAITEHVSGVLLACKHAEQGTLDESAIQRAIRTLRTDLDVLTGLDDPARWPEVRSDPLRRVLHACRVSADVTFVDIHSSIEAVSDPITGMHGERNGAARAVLNEADRIVVVTRPDPVGLARLVRSLGELAEVAPERRPLVIVNRIHRSSEVREVHHVLDRIGIVADIEGVPDDPMVRRAAIRGSLPGELTRRSRARSRLRRVARELLAA